MILFDKNQYPQIFEWSNLTYPNKVEGKKVFLKSYVSHHYRNLIVLLFPV